MTLSRGLVLWLRTALLLVCGCGAEPRLVDYSGPIIDFHAHVLFGLQERAFNPSRPGTEAQLLQGMNDASVAHACIITVAPRGDLVATRRQNDAILALASKHKGRFFPVGSVHPYDGIDSIRELERLASRGARGIKLHPNTQRLDVESLEVEAVVAKCAALGLFVVIDGWSVRDPAQTGKMIRLAWVHPRARIIIAHMAGAGFQDLLFLHALQRHPSYPRNIWFDLSAVAPMFAGSPFEDEFVWVMRKVGIDRALFGSDFPAYSVLEAVQAVRRLPLDANEQRLVFYENAAALLGIG